MGGKRKKEKYPSFDLYQNKYINKQTNNSNDRNGTKQTTEKLYLTWMQLPKNQFIYREILWRKMNDLINK